MLLSENWTSIKGWILYFGLNYVMLKAVCSVLSGQFGKVSVRLQPCDAARWWKMAKKQMICENWSSFIYSLVIKFVNNERVQRTRFCVLSFGPQLSLIDLFEIIFLVVRCVWVKEFTHGKTGWTCSILFMFNKNLPSNWFHLLAFQITFNPSTLSPCLLFLLLLRELSPSLIEFSFR